MERTFFAREVIRDAQGTPVKTSWTTGPILGEDGKTPTGYVCCKDGSVRHGNRQFRGTKKQKKRLVAAMRARLQATAVAPSVKPCCERDHNGDGDCDRHPAK